MSERIEILPITGIGEVRAGDDIAALLLAALPAHMPTAGTAPAAPAGAELRSGDVLVVTQKIVSKAEGRIVAVNAGDPRSHAPHVRAEAVRVLRQRGDLLITETRHGFVCANSGVDRSNMEPGTAALLPVDPDRSARRIRDSLKRRCGLDVAVIVSDTFGRAWRKGLTDVALGCAGVGAICDLRGTTDSYGQELHVTEVCVADEIAGAADLVMGKATGVPAAVVRGVDRSWFRESSVVREVVRPPAEDLFR